MGVLLKCKMWNKVRFFEIENWLLVFWYLFCFGFFIELMMYVWNMEVEWKVNFKWVYL